MKGWEEVEANGMGEDKQLLDWLQLVKAFAETLPPKAAHKDFQ